MAAKQPNIILVTTDQQRYDAAGSAGPSFLRTPHFDTLSREGVTFSRAYADCPLCVPSRVSIMTGKSVFAHGMPSNGATEKVMGHRDTLPAMLRGLGYQTAAIGKMHFTPQRCRHGFDEMVLPADYYNWMARSGLPFQPMRHGLGQNELYPTCSTVPEALSLTNWTADQCMEYIKTRRDPTRPFFLWCSFAKPHPPLDPPEPYYSMYRNCPIPEPVLSEWSTDERAPETFKRMRQRNSYDLIPPEIIREARAAYYGCITQIDYNLGRVLAGLQDQDMLGETLIVYTADHGEYLGDHRTGSKVFFHEPSAHIPFVVRLPKSWQDRRHGTTVSTPVTLADVLPTLVAAAGDAEAASAGRQARPVGELAGEVAAGVDGMDLIALARGQAPARQYLEAGGGSGRDYVAITDGRWKYMYYIEGPAEQLFDIQTDPQERDNLAGQPAHAAQQARLCDELLRRQTARKSECVRDGKFVSVPPMGDSVTDRRNAAWPGYHTEHYRIDVRH